jgi:hypothetical protein
VVLNNVRACLYYSRELCCLLPLARPVSRMLCQRRPASLLRWSARAEQLIWLCPTGTDVRSFRLRSVHAPPTSSAARPREASALTRLTQAATARPHARALQEGRRQYAESRMRE